MKPGRVLNLVQNVCGKSRVRKNSIPLLYNITSLILEELITNCTASDNNIRLKNDKIYSTIQENKTLLKPLQSFVGAGIKLGF